MNVNTLANEIIDANKNKDIAILELYIWRNTDKHKIMYLQ
jgi:hypothetical protein